MVVKKHLFQGSSTELSEFTPPPLQPHNEELYLLMWNTRKKKTQSFLLHLMLLLILLQVVCWSTDANGHLLLHWYSNQNRFTKEGFRLTRFMKAAHRRTQRICRQLF